MEWWNDGILFRHKRIISLSRAVLSHYHNIPVFQHSTSGAASTRRPADKPIRLEAEPKANWSEPLIFRHRGSI